MPIRPTWFVVLIVAWPLLGSVGVVASAQSAAEQAAEALIATTDRALADAPDGARYVAWREQLEALARQHGFAARALVLEAAAEGLGRRRAALRKALEQRAGSQATRDALGRVLERRRRAALRFVFSKRFTKQKQDELQRLLAAVRQAWTEPLTVAAEADASFARTRSRLDALARTRAALFPGEDDPGAAARATLDQRVAVLLDPRQTPSTVGGHKALIEGSRAILLANARWPEAAAAPTEREVMRLVNEHRLMLGRQVLYYSRPLVEAARLHSDYMAKVGVFAHRIKGHPHGYSAKERAATRDYRGLVIENIAAGGVPTAAAAHAAWISSPAHHRGMLDHRVEDIGVARNGNWWTELVGWRNPSNRRDHGPRR